MNLFPLFNDGIPLALCPLIRLGLDLADVGKPLSPRLLSRLRDGAEVWAARLEIELWAALRRQHVVVEYESQLNETTTVPDLRIIWDRREYSVECKTVGRAHGDILGEQIERDFWDQVMPTWGTDGWRVQFSERLAAATFDDERRLELEQRRADVVAEMVALWHAMRAGDRTSRSRDICGMGTMSIAKTEQPRVFEACGFDRCPPAKEADRVLRTVRNAARQLPCRGRGVVFVDAFVACELADLHRLIEARCRLAGPTYSNVDFVVVRRSVRPVELAAIAMPGAVITDGDRSLAQALLSGLR